MFRSKPSRWVPFVLGAGLLPLVGCRQPELRDGGVTASHHHRRERNLLSPRQAADVQIALGRSLEVQGQPAQAIVAYKDAIERDPSRVDALVRLAVLHDRQGKFQESAVYYQKALGARPGDAEIYCDKGYSLYLQNRLADAEMILRQAIVRQPELARAHTNLGLVLAHEGRREQALAEFRRAGCTPTDARLNLAFALTVDGRWAEARREYQLTLASDPRSQRATDGLRDLKRLEANPKLARAAKADPALMTAGLTVPSRKPDKTAAGKKPGGRSNATKSRPPARFGTLGPDGKP